MLLFSFIIWSRGDGDCRADGDIVPFVLLHGDFIKEGVYGPIFVGFVETTVY